MAYQRIVVKIGSSSLTYETGHLNIRKTKKIVEVLADIRNSGAELIVVSSGAMALGRGKLGMLEKPKDLPTKQAVAAIGQCELMSLYDRLFPEYGITVSQLLLTGEDFHDEERSTNCHNTLRRLLELGCIPIINENDTVSVSEIIIGDNDTLSAYVAQLSNADLLILMSDVDGLYDSNPHSNPNAKLIEKISDLEYAEAVAEGSVSAVGTGGMKTKIDAARICRESCTDMVILNGDDPENLYKASAGIRVGTLFPFRSER